MNPYSSPNTTPHRIEVFLFCPVPKLYTLGRGRLFGSFFSRIARKHLQKLRILEAGGRSKVMSKPAK